MSRGTGLRGLAALVTLLLLGACVGPGSTDDLRIMVPNAPGGGYDTTARVVAQVAEDEGLTGHLEVFNLEGASGVVGLARTAHEDGNADLVMMMGLGVVGVLFTTESSVHLDQVTPIARLISEPEVVVVPKGSRFETLEELIQAWAAHPDLIRVGGGSSAGGPDHLAAHLLADAVGIDPRQVRYRQYDGGGPLLAAMFAGRVDFAVSGVGEYVDHIANGEVTVLAVTSSWARRWAQRPHVARGGRAVGVHQLAGAGRTTRADSPRRALPDRPGDAPARDRRGRDAERRYGWSDDLLTGAEFGAFLGEESARVGEVLRDLGFTKHPTSASP